MINIRRNSTLFVQNKIETYGIKLEIRAFEAWPFHAMQL